MRLFPQSRRGYVAAVAVAAVLVCLPLSAISGAPRPGTWIPAGPEGVAALLAIAVDPAGSVYVGTFGGGLYRSDDGSRTWIPANEGLGDPNVTALAIDPADPSVVWAATFHGVFRSADRGGRWEPVALPSVGFNSVLFDPVDPATLYVAGTSPGVYRSTNGGASWSPANVGIGGANPFALVGSGNGTVYLATLDGGVLRTQNRGSTWTGSNSGLGSSHILALAVDPSNPSVLYAGTSNAGVYKSIDGGASWRPSSTGLAPTFASAVAVDPVDPSSVLAGTNVAVYRSVDGGATWAIDPGVSPNVSALLFDPFTPGVVYAGSGRPPLTEGGLFRSEDHGATWRPRVSGIRNVAIQSLELTPRGLYAGLLAGLLRTTDRGNTWPRLRLTGTFTAIAFDPTNADRMYLGSPFGVDVSSDAGATVSRSNMGLTDPSVRAIAVDPASPATLYVGNGVGVSKSIDSGATWIPTVGPTSQILAVAIDPGAHQTVYAAGVSGISRTTDGGSTWRSASNGIPPSLPVFSLVLEPARTSVLFAGTSAGVYRSTDAGSTWSNVWNGPPATNVSALVLDPGGHTLFSGTEIGVFRSDDEGESWAPTGTGLINPKVNALAFDGQGVLFAGTDGAGVFLLQPAPEERGPVSPPDSRRPRVLELPRPAS